MPFISRDRPANSEKHREACRAGHRHRAQANVYIARMEADAAELRRCLRELDELRAALVSELAAVLTAAERCKPEIHEAGGRERVASGLTSG